MIYNLSRTGFIVAELRTCSGTSETLGLQQTQFAVRRYLIIGWQELLRFEMVQVQRQAQFPLEDLRGRRADSEMNCSPRCQQDFDQTNRIHRSTGTCDRDNKVSHG